jgi:hypothetical protein
VEGVALPRLAQVGKTQQEVLLALPPPDAVFLSGSDAELPRPTVSDSVVFRYEMEVHLGGRQPATVFVVFDPATYRCQAVNVVLETVPTEKALLDALGPTSFGKERRRVASDDFDSWVTEEVDPTGGAEVIVFPDLGLEWVHLLDSSGSVFRFR